MEFSNFIRTKSFLSSLLILGSILGSVYFLCWFVHYKIFAGHDIIFTEIPDYTEISIILVLQVTVLGPLIETLLCQKGIYFLLSQSKWLRKHKFYIVLIGGVLFGLLHFFSLSYIIVTMIMGIFFMYAYVIKRHKGGYWIVVLLHAFVNGLALFLSYFE
jgi:membrane protease YdiL (CAAX protease family)